VTHSEGTKTVPDRDEKDSRGLLSEDLAVVNVGLEGFVADLESCGVKVIHVDWEPPAGGDPKMAALLAKLGV
jgi:hypothetical protein